MAPTEVDFSLYDVTPWLYPDNTSHIMDTVESRTQKMHQRTWRLAAILPVCILGMILNICNSGVLLRRYPRTQLATFLLTISYLDVTTCILIGVQRVFLWLKFVSHAYIVRIHYILFNVSLSLQISSYILGIFLAYDRYRAIIKSPDKDFAVLDWSVACKRAIVSLLIGFLLKIPGYFIYEPVAKKLKTGTYFRTSFQFTKTAEESVPYFTKHDNAVLTFLFTGVTLLAMFLILESIRKLAYKYKTINSNPNEREANKRDMTLTPSVIVMLGVSSLCVFTTQLLRYMAREKIISFSNPFIKSNEIAYWLVWLHVAVMTCRPLVYIALCSDYRRRMFCCQIPPPVNDNELVEQKNCQSGLEGRRNGTLKPQQGNCTSITLVEQMLL